MILEFPHYSFGFSLGFLISITDYYCILNFSDIIIFHAKFFNAI